MDAYCVKCRAKRELKNPKAVTLKNGRPAVEGVCPTCGTKMFRIGKSMSKEGSASDKDSRSQTAQATSQTQSAVSEEFTERENIQEMTAKRAEELRTDMEAVIEEGNLRRVMDTASYMIDIYQYEGITENTANNIYYTVESILRMGEVIYAKFPGEETSTILKQLQKHLNYKDKIIYEDEEQRRKELYGITENVRQLRWLVFNDGKSGAEATAEQEETKQETEVPPETNGDRIPAKPTPKVTSDKWVTEDTLGYGTYARIIAMLITHRETVPPLTIGIKAQWGVGKTSVMKMVQHMLDSKADVTEGSEAGLRNSSQIDTPTYQDMKKMLNDIDPVKKLSPTSGKYGKKYGIPGRPTVWFNAWKYQNSEQIWAGLAHCIISQIAARLSKYDRRKLWLKLNEKRTNTEKSRQQIGKYVSRKMLPISVLFAVLLGGFLAASIWWFDLNNYMTAIGGSGITALGIAGNLWDRYKKTKEKISGSLCELITEPIYEGKLGFLHLVEQDIREVLDIVATQEKPLVIFIDDIDRCAPNRIAEIVEAINLFLSGDYPNCIFVIGMEPSVVAASLEVANKALIEKIQEFSVLEESAPLGWRFMEKIVQLPLNIPAPTNAGIDRYIHSIVTPAEPADINKTYEMQAEFIDENKVQYYLKELSASSTVEESINVKKELLDKASAEEMANIKEAGLRDYSQKLVMRDPVIVRFVKEVTDVFKNNPRQLKRYVNMFRFLSTLRYAIESEHTGQESEQVQMPSDETLAKYIVLCLHSPQAVDCMKKTIDVRENGIYRKMPLLCYLEKQANEIATISDRSKADKKWCNLIDKNGFNLGDWGKSRNFRNLLCEGECLSSMEKCGLC